MENYNLSITKNWYWLWDGAINSEICDHIVKGVDWGNSIEGSVSSGNNTFCVDKNYRSTKVVWENHMSVIGCILQTYVHAANSYAGWNFNISHMPDIQLGKYSEDEGSYYDWHVDTAEPENGFQRKLTGVVLLNDPKEFEGGGLQIQGRSEETMLPSKGSVIVFPSFMGHRVTKITSGTRYTAVGWMFGPSFR